MAQAMIGGLLKSSSSSSSAPSSTAKWRISVSEPYEPTRQRLASLFPAPEYSLTVSESTPQLLQTTKDSFDVVVLAVKPQTVAAVCADIKKSPLLLNLEASTPSQQPLLVISIAAGVAQSSIDAWLNGSDGSRSRRAVVVRCMPNTPALVNQGATGLFGSSLSPHLKQLTESILKSISPNALYWLDSESLIDVVTGLSGSGPAYFFLVIEALTDAAVKLGLPKDIARGLATQTCLGAGTMAMSSFQEADAAELRRRVTSPNGTTEAGIRTAESMDVRGLFSAVVEAATKRSAELGAEMAASKI